MVVLAREREEGARAAAAAQAAKLGLSRRGEGGPLGADPGGRKPPTNPSFLPQKNIRYPCKL